MCHSISRGSAVPPLQGRRAGQIRKRARDLPSPLGLEKRAAATALPELAQRFGTGPRHLRGDECPRVASGGPIRSRLAPGNSAVPALRMPRSDASGFGPPGL